MAVVSLYPAGRKIQDSSVGIGSGGFIGGVHVTIQPKVRLIYPAAS